MTEVLYEVDHGGANGKFGNFMYNMDYYGCDPTVGDAEGDQEKERDDVHESYHPQQGGTKKPVIGQKGEREAGERKLDYSLGDTAERAVLAGGKNENDEPAYLANERLAGYILEAAKNAPPSTPQQPKTEAIAQSQPTEKPVPVGNKETLQEFYKHFFWNERFQTLLSRPTTTPEEAKERNRAIHKLVNRYIIFSHLNSNNCCDC